MVEAHAFEKGWQVVKIGQIALGVGGMRLRPNKYDGVVWY